ncbi:MAG TPA: hypothetical protein VFZ66_13340 [Herpetosiphonaceae bacterium]
MFSDDHRDVTQRCCLPLMVLLAVAALVLVLADRGVRAQATMPPPPMSTAAPDFAAIPDTATITETIEAALAAFERATPDQQPVALDQAAIEQIVASPCRPLNQQTFIPCVRRTVSYEPPPIRRADLSLTVWPTPSIRVARGGTLAYELRLTNYGTRQAHSAVVTLPYTTQQMIVTGSKFSRPDDWVSEVTSSYVAVTFAPFAAGEYRTATIFFRVNDGLPNDTVINMRAAYRWSDDVGGGEWRSNWAPLLVGGGNDSAPWVWMEVQPLSGVVGTTFHFYTDRFIPRENITVWLNTPRGTQPTTLRAIADEYGRACVDLKSTYLRPGTYSLVLNGTRSNLTAIARFYVL